MKYKLIDTLSVPRTQRDTPLPLSNIEIIERTKAAFGSGYPEDEIVYFVTDRKAPSSGNVIVEVWLATNGYSHY